MIQSSSLLKKIYQFHILFRVKAKVLTVAYKHYTICPPQLPILLTTRSFFLLLSLHWTPCCLLLPRYIRHTPSLGICTSYSFCQKYFPQDSYRLVIQLLYQWGLPYIKFQPPSYSVTLTPLFYFSLAIIIN